LLRAPFRWVISSAKYGYLEPEHPIGDYDVTFSDKRTGPISDESLYFQVMYQKRWGSVRLRDFKKIVCFCSQTYLDKVRKSFRDTGAQVIDGGKQVHQTQSSLQPEKKVPSSMSETTHLPPRASDFQRALQDILDSAERDGKAYVEVVSGGLHRLVGGYPGSNHRMPVCCRIMRRMMQSGDEVVNEPPKGAGATLIIRYHLPRR